MPITCGAFDNCLIPKNVVGFCFRSANYTVICLPCLWSTSRNHTFSFTASRARVILLCGGSDIQDGLSDSRRRNTDGTPYLLVFLIGRVRLPGQLLGRTGLPAYAL
jgi:hypothetical protein